jgi:hypothetical protein
MAKKILKKIIVVSVIFILLNCKYPIDNDYYIYNDYREINEPNINEPEPELNNNPNNSPVNNPNNEPEPELNNNPNNSPVDEPELKIPNYLYDKELSTILFSEERNDYFGTVNRLIDDREYEILDGEWFNDDEKIEIYKYGYQFSYRYLKYYKNDELLFSADIINLYSTIERKNKNKEFNYLIADNKYLTQYEIENDNLILGYSEKKKFSQNIIKPEIVNNKIPDYLYDENFIDSLTNIRSSNDFYNIINNWENETEKIIIKKLGAVKNQYEYNGIIYNFNNDYEYIFLYWNKNIDNENPIFVGVFDTLHNYEGKKLAVYDNKQINILQVFDIDNSEIRIFVKYEVDIKTVNKETVYTLYLGAENIKFERIK